MNIQDAEKLVKGDYIITEFEFGDERNKQHGFCKAQVKRFIPDWTPIEYNCGRDDGDNYPPQPTIECLKLITVDGIETDDMFIGVNNIAWRFMTEEEIIEFNSHFN